MHDLDTLKFRNEERAKNMKAARCLGNRPVPVPNEVKDEIIDDILEIVAFEGDAKKAKKKLRKLLTLWLD